MKVLMLSGILSWRSSTDNRTLSRDFELREREGKLSAEF